MKAPIELPSLSLFRHREDVQLRFNDIDILGHVNNTVYLSIYDLGKARWMGAVRTGHVNWQRVDTIIVNIDCAFIKEIKYGDKIRVMTRCTHIGHKSFTLQQILVDDKDVIHSVCETVMVCYNPDTHTTEEVSEQWRSDITAFEGDTIGK
ncbi:MAG: acyl-CoA thioesterase [Clostridium sp.]|nr:acyl-CoA thioesterase [Prevotella sp.]MCM1428450.1 acyl-CoA thioesterase [Clostridium sp.]MCM1474915.1 acyl-CoA thioesterase [Muribaculaceae bacterium]